MCMFSTKVKGKYEHKLDINLLLKLILIQYNIFKHMFKFDFFHKLIFITFVFHKNQALGTKTTKWNRTMKYFFHWDIIQRAVSMFCNILSHLYKQWTTKCDGGGGGVGPWRTTVLGDVDDSAPAKEGHVGRQTAHGRRTGDVSVRHGHPVVVDHQPQVGLLAPPSTLSGEEELVDAFDRSLEHSGSPVEGPAHINQNLAVLDPVHLPRQLARKRSKEMDLLGRHWKWTPKNKHAN